MAPLLQFGLVNAVLVTFLAVIVALIGARVRRPALVHALWIIVLAKLVIPPVVEIPIELPLPVRASDRAPEAIAPAVARAVSAASTEVFGSVGSIVPENVSKAAPATGNSAVPSVSLAARLGLEELGRYVANHTGKAFDGARLIWSRETPWLPWTACGIWTAGACLYFARQGWLVWRFHRRLALAAPAPAEIQRQTARLAREMGLTRCPEVVLVPEVISPMLSGIGPRIRLVFPSGLLERLDSEARGTLLAHELAHFGRRDHWVRGLELIVTGSYWWHPVVWWARRRIEAAEEECCDAWVITRFAATPRVYAEALLEAIDFLSESRTALPPVATGLGQAHFLRRRLTQIMRGAAPLGLSYPARALVLVAMALLPVHPAFSRFRDSASAEVVATFTDHSDAVRSAAIAPDGSCLVSDSRDGGIIVWRPDSQRRLNSLRLARAPVDSVAVSRDGKRLAVAAGSWMSLATGYVALWDLASLLEHEGLEGHSAVGAVVFHEDGRSLVVGEWSGRITVWNLLTRLPAGVGFVPGDVISSARFSADTQSLSHIDPAAVPAAHVPRDAAGGASAEFGEQPASVLDDLRPALRGTPR